MIAQTPPRGPVYINLDARTAGRRARRARRRCRRSPVCAAAAARAGRRRTARRGRAARPRRTAGDPDGPRLARSGGLADGASSSPRRLGARVMTDLKAGIAFPTDHPLHAAGPATSLSPAGVERVVGGRRHSQPRLDRSRRDLERALTAASRFRAKVVQVSADQYAAQRLEHGLPRVCRRSICSCWSRPMPPCRLCSPRCGRSARPRRDCRPPRSGAGRRRSRPSKPPRRIDVPLLADGARGGARAAPRRA